MKLAALYRWRFIHHLPARRRDGSYATLFQGMRGFPDLVLVHPSGRFLIREVKEGKGVVSADQRKWIDQLRNAGVDAGVWRWPEDEQLIRDELNTRRKREKEAA